MDLETKIISLANTKKWIKSTSITISLFGLIVMWFLLTIGIIKGYPIANQNGEIVAMMTPISSRVISEHNWVEFYKNKHNISDEVKLYRVWKKNWFKLGMWSSYVNEKEYWGLDYIEVNDKWQ